MGVWWEKQAPSVGQANPSAEEGGWLKAGGYRRQTGNNVGTQASPLEDTCGYGVACDAFPLKNGERFAMHGCVYHNHNSRFEICDFSGLQ